MSGKMQESLTMRLSKLYLDAMQRMIDGGLYGSKSEIVREALRLFFEKQGVVLWKVPREDKVLEEIRDELKSMRKPKSVAQAMENKLRRKSE